MTLTRSQLGETPRKTEHPGYVETPTRQTRSSRKSRATESFTSESEAQTSPVKSRTSKSKAEKTAEDGANGAANGQATVKSKTRAGPGRKSTRKSAKEEDDEVPEYEFGGPIGVSSMMIGFPLLMYYMWIGATFYDGHFPTPAKGESLVHFLRSLGQLAYQGAFPGVKAWAIYWVFLAFEAVCYLNLPGITLYGKPLKSLGGQRLEYYCSGMWSFYVTILTAVALHFSGLFKLYTIMDEFGPVMSVAILSGFLTSFALYTSALYRGVQIRMTGNHAYDFFMGAELNPRLFGLFDFKMFLEVRLPWYILFLLTLGTAARQYEQFGYVSGEVGFLLMAHFLYANACSKAEEAIVTTWDMYYEKLGFMLAFWNMAGVPFTYCTATVYLSNHAPSVYHWNPILLGALYIMYLFAYWVWDTCNAQKNRFRQQERGTLTHRKTFPQLPWQTVKNPKTIPTHTGDSILVDGWYGYARKIHYTCDMFFAFSWGLVTGFASPFPYFYTAFFTPMIFHRAWRDNLRCQERYGEAWTEYRRRVPYIFLPYVF